MSNDNDWDKYQKLVLKELKSLRYANERINDELITFQKEMAEVKSSKEFVRELKKVATVSQYDDLYRDVSMLKRFKIQISTAIIIIQFIFGFIMWYLNYAK